MRDPAIQHLNVVAAANAAHLAAVKAEDKLLDGSPDREVAGLAAERAMDEMFSAVERFLTDRRPTSVRGVAMLLAFAADTSNQHVFPDHLDCEREPWPNAVMRVCAEALADL